MNKIFLMLLGLLLVASFVNASGANLILLGNDEEDTFKKAKQEFNEGKNFILDNYEHYGKMDIWNVPCLSTVNGEGYIVNNSCNVSCVKSCLEFSGTNKEIECLSNCGKIYKQDKIREEQENERIYRLVSYPPSWIVDSEYNRPINYSLYQKMISDFFEHNTEINKVSECAKECYGFSECVAVCLDESNITYEKSIEPTVFYLEEYNIRETWFKELIRKVTKFMSSEEDSSTEELRENEY